MAIFDIEKDDLLRLTDTQLEELVARLAEAEVAANGHSPAWVCWSGSINAPDEGIDVHVQVPVSTLNTGFLEKADTILQAKKHSMPKAEIMKEMVDNGVLSQTISEQAAKGGSYIIVSLGDDCSPPRLKNRLRAMREAVKEDPNSGNIHLNFYDRSKLTQWLRQHPSIMLWAKGKLGQGYSGWQPYGAWSNPPHHVVDNLITAPGVAITLPSEKSQKLSIEDGIGPMRDLVRSTKKAIRVTGLSGVGKTRIVQALFDETIGSDALDKTIAIYVDTGAEPAPSAAAMLERLIAEGRRAVMVLDNCPAALHSALASRVSAASTEVRLITVEYDIRDDKPQTTEVIHIEAVGPEVAERLLIRRFLDIGQINARRIAEFADGNARVSLAIAERLAEGESLAQLSDAQLFDRLFEQRNHPDENLREQAEILSLVYSFSVSTLEDGYNELEVLGSISGHSQLQLFRSVKTLSGRHVVQKRGHWRAILPHAIANKLAVSALESIPVDQLKATFEVSGRQRLLMSFAHRLGQLHDHPVAREIVETWLQPDGLLGGILKLEGIEARILDYIGPVVPEVLLDRIETELNEPDFEGMKPGSLQRTTILRLLQLLAYDASTFDRCVRLLIRVADYEDENNNYDAVRDKITQLFQAYLSGTHASLDQRIAVMNECLSSDVAGRRSLGFRMLSTALNGPPWTGYGTNEFGARPRDFGFQPNHDELVEWRSAFIDVAVRLGTCGDPELEGPARQTLANVFQGIWRHKAMRDKIVDAARKLNSQHPWVEGWKAVRSTIYFDHTKHKNKDDCEPLPNNLALLNRDLKPIDLVPAIMTYVFGKGHDYWALDADFDPEDTNKYREAEKRLEAKALQLGEDFAASDHGLDELGPNLLSGDGMPYRAAFGRGLAKGCHNLRASWQQLINQLEQLTEGGKDFAVFAGFIEQVHSDEPALAQELLDQCAQHSQLRNVLVGLHPQREFTETDLDRCMALLDDPAIYPRMYGPILCRDEYAHLPESRVLDLAQRLLNKPSGNDVVLEALSMRLPHREEVADTLGAPLRRIGLIAAIQRFKGDHRDVGGCMDYSMERVVSSALNFAGNEAEKQEWLDTIIATIDEHYGYIHAFESAIATTISLMPRAFLDRVFAGAEIEKHRRLFFIQDRGLRQSPLAKTDVNVLIKWCQANNDNGVWASIAEGISLWSANDDERGVVTISETAIRLLEASPEPEAILEAFAGRVTPSYWSGSRADVMQPRADAIGRLVEHERPEISQAAKSIATDLDKLTTTIECQREREQREDEEREQRFE